MTQDDYRHVIEYARRNEPVKYTEVVFDHGWYINTGEAWRIRYTAGCAQEFLERRGAAPGEWFVVVWRSRANQDRDRVCAIRYDAEVSATGWVKVALRTPESDVL
jgi:hypothetical protein